MFIGFMLAYYLPVVMLKGFICRPVQKFWSANTEGQCFNQRALILADVCISVLSDLIIFTLPLPLVTNLQMPLKTKLRVAAVFSAGGLACVASIIRLVDIVRNGTDPNQTLVFMRVNLWGYVRVRRRDDTSTNQNAVLLKSISALFALACPPYPQPTNITSARNTVELVMLVMLVTAQPTKASK